ncbi:hypothetical protein WG66_009356 [Moniliophthora roreri]|nr:hypothetical protein WG66_009356 [Moniliophthora roreri]
MNHRLTQVQRKIGHKTHAVIKCTQHDQRGKPLSLNNLLIEGLSPGQQAIANAQMANYISEQKVDFDDSFQSSRSSRTTMPSTLLLWSNYTKNARPTFHRSASIMTMRPLYSIATATRRFRMVVPNSEDPRRSVRFHARIVNIQHAALFFASSSSELLRMVPLLVAYPSSWPR